MSEDETNAKHWAEFQTQCVHSIVSYKMNKACCN